ncbi:hypothetical protein FVE85_2089 [Porphyridium purpureum]|uniref:Histidine phosphatase family protein n=1 Tax=Porphyridium purpureum TaxID=35688 RepID=A0A5J4YYY3_PORPP|nr:hypothetical protein FVE85_2089 [Porphyridium purpureum]|eukprot:POR7391..scf209_3
MEARLYLVRHGRSRANDAGIIVSALQNGVRPEYGLTDGLGREQARAAGQKLAACIEGTGAHDPLVILAHSPFSRTEQTADEMARGMADASGTFCAKLLPVEQFRERDFGAFELSSDANYETVWEHDAVNDVHWLDTHGVERAEHVLQRMMHGIQAVYEHFRATEISLCIVSHGDALQILRAHLAAGIPPNLHRQLDALQNAQIVAVPCERPP